MRVTNIKVAQEELQLARKGNRLPRTVYHWFSNQLHKRDTGSIEINQTVVSFFME